MKDTIYMQRCLELAKLGQSKAAPNPMVGCVIVHKGVIIGEGYHQKYGEAHAEVNAINSVKDKNLLTESTLYVNLEPCAHYGKTPPCALLIKTHKIPHVVIGCIDPYSEVAGKGVEILKEAGIKVTIGILEKESLHLNKRFLTFHQKKRPYIILKWAESKDGFIDGYDATPKWLTNEESRAIVHKMRDEEAAIMVGTNTVKKDNPSLTIRSWAGQNPVRITIDRNKTIERENHIFDAQAQNIIFTNKDSSTEANNEWVNIDFAQDILPQCMNTLYKKGINSVIVEGGEQLLNSFIESELWDEAWQFIGTCRLKNGVKAPSINHNINKSMHIKNVNLNIYEK